MARQKRLQIAGGIYHVITRGINRTAIFKDRTDRCEFLSQLETTLIKFPARCYAWALMGNHLHLLLRMLDQPLSKIMSKLLAGYAVYFNHRHKRHGYLYQNRFKSILCQEEVYFQELIRYIHLNPVRAGLITSQEELDRYPWTGHAVIVGRRKAAWQTTDEVLTHFGTGKSAAMAAYRRYITDGWAMGKQERLTGGGLRRSAGGWQKVLEGARNREFWRGEDQILGDDAFVKEAMKRAEEEMDKREKRKLSGWNLESLAEKVCGLMGVKMSDLAKRGRCNTISFAKGLVVYWGQTEAGQSMTQIAKFLGMSRAGAQKAFLVGEKVARDRELK
jgi:putative transposase